MKTQAEIEASAAAVAAILYNHFKRLARASASAEQRKPNDGQPS